MNIRYIRKWTLLFSLSVIMLSCNKFLEVDPLSEIPARKVLVNDRGFSEYMTGIYINIAGINAYGMAGSWYIVDLMGQLYNTNLSYPSGNQYERIRLFDYNRVTNSTGMNAIDNLWSSMYNSIANLNFMLDELEKNQEGVLERNYHLFKGEGLGLRAFCHFDLLRMFAPSYASGAEKPGIPYVKQIALTITPQSSVQKCLEYVIADCDSALVYLAVSDPIYLGDEPFATDANWFWTDENRRIRMNYYAVQAVKARAYLYMNNYVEAEKAAKLALDDVKYPWVTLEQINNPIANGYADRLFFSEIIFCMHNALATSYANNYVGVPYSNPELFQTEAYHNLIYETNKTANQSDWRHLYQYNQSAGDYFLRKFQVPNWNGVSADPVPEVQRRQYKHCRIRKTELYYILAECANEQGRSGEAIELLNTVRQNRGIAEDLPSTLNKEEVDQEIFKEYRKEFVAEGQMFFYYKRKNWTSIPNVGDLPTLTDQQYVFPMPLLEEEIGDRETLH